MEKVIFLDRDGTINVEKDYLYRIEDFQFEDGALEALKIFKELGYKVVVVTNQSGIARGYYKESDLINLNNYMKDRVKEYGGEIQSCYYCPHHPEKGIGDYKTECSCRKPEIGMLLEAQREMDIDKKNSFIVGDKVSDLKAGEKFGVTPILVKTGYGKKTLSKENITCETFENLKEFAENLKQKNGLKVK